MPAARAPRACATVMWGASGGDDLLGDDFVPLAALQQEVRVLARLVSDYLG